VVLDVARSIVFWELEFEVFGDDFVVRVDVGGLGYCRVSLLLGAVMVNIWNSCRFDAKELGLGLVHVVNHE
jgi:hypothetical protein